MVGWFSLLSKEGAMFMFNKVNRPPPWFKEVRQDENASLYNIINSKTRIS